MKIVIMVEGRTERAFMPILRPFLESRLGGRMPRLRTQVHDGAVPTGDKLKRAVEALLTGRDPWDHVIWLTDLYPGRNLWTTAAEAKERASAWVGDTLRFHPHTACHDFEAWLLPYWPRIMQLAKTNRSAPAGPPELVNHNTPPAYWIKEAYRVGAARKDYKKAIDAAKILKDQDLMVAIRACPELKSFVNRILALSGVEEEGLL
jgi:hypothetical protein